MLNKLFSIASLFMLIGISSCKKDEPSISSTPYTLVQPYKFPIFPEGEDQNLTEEGIALGRRLFYDPILSGDSTMACATCHIQKDGFSDKRKFSIGIDGSIGNRQAMPIINVAWMTELFWDGRSAGVKAQALEPVINPIEMMAHWDIVVEDLSLNSVYADLFNKAFPKQGITKHLVVEAIAQFEKTIISSNSKFDQYLKGQYTLTDSELKGYNLFYSEQADCFHCHAGALTTDLAFHNNGLDTIPVDNGLEYVTNKTTDRGKFKTPSLRNISYTAPYMHDGRFATLDEVLDFYSAGVQTSPTVDALMEFSAQGGVTLNTQEKADLKAFLLTFDDEVFINNPDFSNPF
jgi:cytochrome c peroxidase